MRELDQLEALKPAFQKHDIASATMNRKGELEVVGGRFKTRVRMHDHHQVDLPNHGPQNHAKSIAIGFSNLTKGKSESQWNDKERER